MIIIIFGLAEYVRVCTQFYAYTRTSLVRGDWRAQMTWTRMKNWNETLWVLAMLSMHLDCDRINFRRLFMSIDESAMQVSRLNTESILSENQFGKRCTSDRRVQWITVDWVVHFPVLQLMNGIHDSDFANNRCDITHHQIRFAFPLSHSELLGSCVSSDSQRLSVNHFNERDREKKLIRISFYQFSTAWPNPSKFESWRWWKLMIMWQKQDFSFN